MGNVKYPKIEVQDLQRNPICILSYQKSSISELTINHNVNETSTLSFRLEPSDFAMPYMTNENLLKIDNKETYIIKSIKLEDSDGAATYVIEAESEFCTLKDKQLPKMDYIAESPETLITKVLEGTIFSYKGTNIPEEKLRHLNVSAGDSVFAALVQIANNFDAYLTFNTFELPDGGGGSTTVRGVGLYAGEINNGRYFKKGRDLNSTDITYSTNEMVTKLEVLGKANELGIPITMMEVHPEGKTYVENYDFFTSKGVSLEEIKENKDPRFVKELTVTVNELTTPQQVYDYALDEIKRLSVPLVECNCTVGDLSLFEEYMLNPLELCERIVLIDETIGFEATANVMNISKNYDNVMESNVSISNIIERKSIIKDLIDNSNTVDKVIDNDGNINGGFIEDGTIVGDKIVADSIEAIHIKAQTITADRIASKTITAEQIAAGAITAGSGVIADGAIGSAQISELDANKITSGTIDTSRVEVNGEGSSMRIKGNQILAIDNTDLLDQKVKAIFGEYMKEDETITHGLAIYGKNGSLMIDEDGVHKGGIVDNSITNTEINTDANIDGSKLNIKTTIDAVNNFNGAEKINSVMINVDGKSLDVALKEYNTLITEQGENIQTNTSKIEANAREIALKVGQQTYYEDKQQFENSLRDIDNKIDGLQIGGNNLFAGTKNFASSKWDNVELTGEVYLGGKIAKVKGMYPNTPSTLMSKQLLSFQVGETYTVQVEAKARIEGLKLGVSIDSGKINHEEKVIDHSKFTKYTWTFTSENDDLDIFRFDSSNATDENYIEIARIKVEIGSKATDWTPSYEDIYMDIEESKQQIADIIADNKFTPNEKQDILREINAIKAEKIQIEAQCSLYPDIELELNSYLTAYNQLIEYISPLIEVGVMNETSEIEAETFRQKFSNYYDERSTLMVALDKEAKSTIDEVKAKAEKIQQGVDKAQGQLDDIQNIDKLTPSEKQNMKVQWETIQKNYAQNIQLAEHYKIETEEKTNYVDSYEALKLVIEPCLVGEQMDNTTDVDGVDIANKQVDYYDKEAILVTLISKKAKDIGDNALNIATSSLQEAKDYADEQIQDVKDNVDDLIDNAIDGAWRDGLIDEMEAIAIYESIKSLDTEKMDIDKSFESLYDNQDLDETLKLELEGKYSQYVDAHDSLISYIIESIEDKVAGEEEKENIDELRDTYNEALADYKVMQTKALENIAFNKARAEIEGMKQAIDEDIDSIVGNMEEMESHIKASIKDGIIDEAEKLMLDDNIKDLEKDKISIDKQYSSLSSNENLLGTAKTNLNDAKREYDAAYNSYIGYINTLIEQEVISEDDIEEMERLQGIYDSAFALFCQRINEALESIVNVKVNEIKSDLDDIVSDNKFTPNEKNDISRDLEGIKKEYAQLIKQAEMLAITTEKEGYTEAYNDLVEYLTPLLENMGVTSDIEPETFKNKFTNYIDKRSLLFKKISEVLNNKANDAQSVAEQAKQKAEEAMGEINNIGSDSKITSVEKLILSDRWEEIKKEYPSICNQASQYEVPCDNYTLHYNNLDTYLNGDNGILNDMTVTSNVDREVYQSKFNTYYTYRQEVLENIAFESKKDIEQAIVDSKAYTDGQITVVTKQFEVVNSEIKAMKDKISLTVTKDELEETVININNNQPYKVEIASSKGDKFTSNQEINTILEAMVFKGREDVTDSFEPFQFVWERLSIEGVGDEEWNAQHIGVGKTINITREDFRKQAKFTCIILDEDGRQITM